MSWWGFYCFILLFCELVGFLGFLLLQTLSFCKLVGVLGFWVFLLLHTLSFCELVGFLGFFAASYFVVLRVGGIFGVYAAS